MTKKKEELESYQVRCAQSEKALEDCRAALELVPIWALQRGQTWVPSEVAIHLLKVAKDSVTNYAKAHWKTGNGN